MSNLLSLFRNHSLNTLFYKILFRNRSLDQQITDEFINRYIGKSTSWIINRHIDHYRLEDVGMNKLLIEIHFEHMSLNCLMKNNICVEAWLSKIRKL